MSNLNPSARKWLFTINWSLDFEKPLKLLSEHERWRKVALILKLSKTARSRLEWIIYYHDGYNASKTCRHFSISRKTFYKWYNVFDRENIYSLYLLEDNSKAPLRVRQREITPSLEQRIVALRKSRMCYGKMKLKEIFEREYQEKISSWKIQKVIEVHKLYPNPTKTARISRKRKRAQKKKRITELELFKLPWYKKKAGFIICLDVIELYWNSLRRYIFTAIDKYGKFAFARMYETKNSLNARDFLQRLYFLLDGKIPRVGHDNGSEFEKLFKASCKELSIEQYWNRPRTPKDNPENERFNQTLKREFLEYGNFNPEPQIFNPRLTEWLIEYNFFRPHQSLGYKTPLEFSKVLPMYSSCTGI